MRIRIHKQHAKNGLGSERERERERDFEIVGHCESLRTSGGVSCVPTSSSPFILKESSIAFIATLTSEICQV